MTGSPMGDDDAGDRYRDDVRFFNIAGPCEPELNYMLPPEPRLPDARDLIDEGQYFVVHAPRQTGKTTTLTALARQLTAEGQYAALLFSCENAAWTKGDVGAAEALVLDSLRLQAELDLPEDLWPPTPWPDAPPGNQLARGLAAWARACPRPLVLVFDEIDALADESLISVLRQLRNGFRSRPRDFPLSVVLCGLRNVRDYKAASGGDPDRRASSSPFNINAKSMLIGDFTREQVAELYGQHTKETGQEFSQEAVERAFEYSQGQPWLTNAIAREVIREMKVKPPEPITVAHVEEAKERLILARATHLDYLAERLRESRVQRVIGPLLAGMPYEGEAVYDDDFAYVQDLGLIARGDPVRVANPVYKEVIVRVLATRYQREIQVDPRSFLLPDGQLDFRKMLEEFAAWWRQNGPAMAKGEMYQEAACQLIFMAYLQRVVNGGGYVDREYGVGSGRIDLLVRKPYTDADGKDVLQREAIELKVRRPGRGNPLRDGLAQIDGYLAELSLDSGYLIIFDQRASAQRGKPRAEITETATPSGRAITLLRVLRPAQPERSCDAG